MLRKSLLRPVLFICSALLLFTSTPLYSQTSKVSYRVSGNIAHISLDEFWQSRFNDDWKQHSGNFKSNYFKPQAGLNIGYDLNQSFSLLFGAEIAKVSVSHSHLSGCDISGCTFIRSQIITENIFFIIPFNAGFEYSFRSKSETIIPFIDFGLTFTMGRFSEIYTNDQSDDRSVSKFKDNAYGMYVTLGFKRKFTDKFGLLVMGKYRNSDSLFGEWNSNDIILNLSGFNLGMAVEWSR